MAIIGTDQDEWTQKAPQATPAAGAAPAPTGGASGSIGGGSGQGATTAVRSSSAPTASGNYTNLTSYLGASGGNGSAMGKTAENVVRGQDQQAGQALSTYQDDASRQIQGAVTPGTTSTKTNADGSVTTTNGATTYNGPQSTAQITGPAADAKSKYDSLVQQIGGAAGQAGGGQTGVQSLLKESYAQPSYTSGESGLDAFLTGASPGGQQSLKSIQAMPGALGTQAGQVDKSLTKNIADANALKRDASSFTSTPVVSAKPSTEGPVKIATVPNQANPATVVDAAAKANLAKETATKNAAIAKAAAAKTKTGKAGSAHSAAPTPPPAPPPTPQAGTINIQSPDMPAIPDWYAQEQMRQLAATGGAPETFSISASSGGRVPAYSELVAKLKAKR